MTTYRAAYLTADPVGDCVVLTRPEHAEMSDEDLRAEALAEARRGDIIDMDEADPGKAFPRMTRANFDRSLAIGDWTE